MQIMKRIKIRVMAVVGALALVLSVAACSSADSGGRDSDSGKAAKDSGPVTLTLANKPTADKKEELAFWKTQVEAFEKANPRITVKGLDVEYDPTTFQAQLAGGTLPHVISVPFTEMQSLIERRQVAEISDTLSELGIKDRLNDATLSVATGEDGEIYGVPQQAYAIGLFYNRDLFTKAGLDPDAPPTTWEDVRSAAKQISERTGQVGFSMPTADNAGGWMFTAMSYGFGGMLENEDGSEPTLTHPGNVAALELLRSMKFEDRSMGKTVLLKWDEWQKDFAAGKVGMRLGAPDMYYAFVAQNNMPKSSLGLTALPQSSDGRGTLSGGAVSVLSPKASAAEKTAAAKWIDFYYLKPFTDKDLAVENAKKGKATGVAVGLPMIAPVSEANLEQYYSWIEPYINVPLDQMKGFIDSPVNEKLVPEPPAKAQELYARLDTLLQRALAKPTPPSKELLSAANDDVKTLLSR